MYLDASALVKLYLPERGSNEVNRSVRGRRDLVVSDLTVTELVSALARRRREGSLRPEAASRLRETVLLHLSAGIFERVLGLDPRTHRQAERLLFSSSRSLRAGDALHLALAASAEARAIVTFDLHLAEAARATGLRAIPEM